MAGYTPVSDVVEHSQLDLDMQKLEAAADEFDFATAYEEYSVGGESDKSDGTKRTIQGFSTAAEGKLDAEPYFQIYESYWGDPAYADAFTSSACQGTGAFAAASNLTRSEGCLKGAQYQNVWMYVIHELEDAVNDCRAEDVTANGGGVVAWDEGWAFYTGSLEGVAVGGSTTDEGQMIYALAEKRCENFGTCNDAGVSEVNTQLLALWTKGQAHVEALECDEAAAVIKEIVPLMAVPLVQGLLRYTYEADPAVVGGAVPHKEASELWAFSAAILPLIDYCDSTVADTVRANTDIAATQTAPMSDGFASVKADLENVYECMNITCALVGGYLDETTGTYFPGFEPCEDPADVAGGGGTLANIAGYAPGSDVVEHSELDLDMAAIETGADALDEAGFTAAFEAYSVGEHSDKSDGTLRTIQGFSTEADGKLDDEPYFEIWKGYWNDPAYADAFTSSACQGTGDFADVSFMTRSEGCLKGAQYQNVWMYVIHELEDALNDCRAGDISDNDGGVHAWDEGWAFYAGSLEGTAVGGSTTDEGQMIYALAEKRCENFGTCNDDGVSEVNTELLDLWTQGKVHLEALECDEAEAVKEAIVPLMAVPLVQGLLRYTYEADPAVVDGEVPDKEASELWAFSAAILPWIHECDPTVAEVVRANTDIMNTATAPMSDGFATVKAELETVYGCMGITCSQVGGYIDETTEDYFAGFEPCVSSDSDSGDSGDRSAAAAGDSSSDSGDLSGGGIAGVTIAVGAVAAALVVGFVLLKKRNARNKAASIDDNLGNF